MRLYLKIIVLNDKSHLEESHLSHIFLLFHFSMKNKMQLWKEPKGLIRDTCWAIYHFGCLKMSFSISFLHWWKSIDFSHRYSRFMQQSFEIMVLPVSVQADMDHLSAVVNAILWSILQELCISPSSQHLLVFTVVYPTVENLASLCSRC